MDKTDGCDPIKALAEAKYRYDLVGRRWYHNRRQAARSDVMTWLIDLHRERGATEPGQDAQAAIADAEIAPEITFARFKARYICRDPGHDTKGIDVFVVWATLAGYPITPETAMLWCKHHSMLVRRFYDAAIAAGITITRCGRIDGVPCRHTMRDVRLIVPRQRASEEPKSSRLPASQHVDRDAVIHQLLSR